MPIEVRPYDGRPEEWDEFVKTRSGYTHFHGFGWRGLMENALGHDTLYLAARDDKGSLAGVMPLVRVKSLLFGHYLVSMPVLNYGGPCGSCDAVRARAAEAVAIADRDGADLLEMRSRGELPLDLPASHRKVTVVLDLEPGDPEPTFAALKSKVRSQGRRPMKEGVEVHFGPDQLEPFYRVFAENMRDLGTPVLGKPVFEAMREEFADKTILSAEQVEDVIAYLKTLKE